MYTGVVQAMQASISSGVSDVLSVAEIERRLHERYRVSGFSKRTWENDRALFRRICKAVGHPTNVQVGDMEAIILSADRVNSRAIYAERFKSLWHTLRDMGLIDGECRPDEELPYIRRTKNLPRPLSPEQVSTLLHVSRAPMQQWFVLGCFAGLRAMEVAGLKGTDLESTADGYVLRIMGKGRKEATIPAHPLVVEVIQAEGRLGRLWPVTANKVSRLASAEMRRLGIGATFHACRHTFATSVLSASGDITIVASLLRHESIATSVVYTKIADDKPRAILNLLTPSIAAA